MHRAQIMAYLPIPEIVLFRDELRQEIQFLRDRDELWSKFKECLAERTNLSTNVIIHGFGKLQWRIKGEMLGMSVHQARISNDHRMKHRPPIPLIVRKAYRDLFDSIEYNIIQEVLIYPSLYAETRRRIVSSQQSPISIEFIKANRSDMINSLRKIKQRISSALFRRRDRIQPSFSNCFQIQLSHSKRAQSNQSSFVLNTISSNDQVSITLSQKCSKLFINRLCNAVSFTFAHRVIIPVLWHVVQDINLANRKATREIIECLFTSNSPMHYLHSKRLSAHVCPWAYQRKVYERIAQKNGLIEMEKELRNEFVEWLQNIPAKDSIFLVDCTEPLRTILISTIRKIHDLPGVPELVSPVSNIFDYLTLAYLHDQIIMTESPHLHKIADDRMGIRTAHQIHQGTKKLESEFADKYKEAHEKDDLYPVPGKALNILIRMNLITSKTSKKTSSRMTFQINIENSQVIEYYIQKRQEFDTSAIMRYGA